MEEAGPNCSHHMYQCGESLIVRTTPGIEKGRSVIIGASAGDYGSNARYSGICCAYSVDQNP